MWRLAAFPPVVSCSPFQTSAKPFHSATFPPTTAYLGVNQKATVGPFFPSEPYIRLQSFPTSYLLLTCFRQRIIFFGFPVLHLQRTKKPFVISKLTPTKTHGVPFI